MAGKYPNNWGFDSTFAQDESEGILLRVLIQILNEVAETNRLLILILDSPNKAIKTTDAVLPTA